ncbi:hypothetical protein BH24ACT26_BH24ACT26_15350 [soil metagenome]
MPANHLLRTPSLGYGAGTYPGLVLRVGAIIFFVVGAYVAYVGVAIGASILRLLLEGPWLGFEPELLIAIGVCLVAALLMWMGRRLWRQGEPG